MSGCKLSVDEQVRCLLDQATDPNILGRSWQGWKPWLWTCLYITIYVMVMKRCMLPHFILQCISAHKDKLRARTLCKQCSLQCFRGWLIAGYTTGVYVSNTITNIIISPATLMCMCCCWCKLKELICNIEQFQLCNVADSLVQQIIGLKGRSVPLVTSCHSALHMLLLRNISVRNQSRPYQLKAQKQSSGKIDKSLIWTQHVVTSQCCILFTPRWGCLNI